jgi:hypothetical protein
MKTRRERFIEDVARAARAARPAKPRGRPSPDNLSDAGRRLGLMAIQAAPRCQSKKRNGEPCRNPAVRGARRCAIHGGRVEVPNHPSNIRRFLTGDLTAVKAREHGSGAGSAAYEAMTRTERTEFHAALPTEVINDDRRLFQAALLWVHAERAPSAGWRSAWAAAVRPKALSEPARGEGLCLPPSVLNLTDATCFL